MNIYAMTYRKKNESKYTTFFAKAEDLNQAIEKLFRVRGKDIYIKTISSKEDLKKEMETVVNNSGSESLQNHIDNSRKIYGRSLKSVTFDEVITKPSHYTKGIETMDYINSWDMSFMEGNIIKYVTRYKYKNGLEDLKKAHEYLTRLIEKESSAVQKFEEGVE